MNAETVRSWLHRSHLALHEQREYLTQLDAAIGDADHGTNMDRGFQAVEARVDDLDAPPGKILTTAGATLVSTVGGASGPLYGTALRRAGRSLGEEAEPSDRDVAAALRAALDGVVELGAANEGDKTMVDALAPAVRALDESLSAGDTLADGLSAAARAAEDGAKATIPLQARKGRASYLGERSVGHQDPGATSAAIILVALEQAVAEG